MVAAPARQRVQFISTEGDQNQIMLGQRKAVRQRFSNTRGGARDQRDRAEAGGGHGKSSRVDALIGYG